MLVLCGPTPCIADSPGKNEPQMDGSGPNLPIHNQLPTQVGKNVSNLLTTSDALSYFQKLQVVYLPLVGQAHQSASTSLELKEEGHLTSRGRSHRTGPEPCEQSCSPPSQRC